MTPGKPITDAIIPWLHANGLGAPVAWRPLSGGSICESFAVSLASGDTLFLKTRQPAPARLFACEANGLAALASIGALRVPAVLDVGEDFLLLEFIAAGRAAPDYWQQLAQGLAAMHRQPVGDFGFEEDNYCGLTPQPNPRLADGFAFFGEHRLLYQAAMARDKALLTSTDVQQLERLVKDLPNRLPSEPPAMIHGDLWSGNIHCDPQGQPVLIDPACHRGWREADIAMTCLFGTLPDRFYDAYQHCLPMPAGWQQRMPIYNLYHLLNHLNLFGGGYLQSVRSGLSQLGV